MFLLNHILNLFRQDRAFGALRSGKWSEFRKSHIKKYCELCEKKGSFLRPLELHHVKPFHLFPFLELDPDNVITVCRHCHLYFAHLGSFKSFCLEIKKLAEEWRLRRKQRQ